MDSWNCRLKHSVPVEPSGRFQFPDHAESHWIHETVVSNTRFRWNRMVGSSFQVMQKIVGFIEPSSQTPGSSGTERSVPAFRSCRKSLDSWNCRLKTALPMSCVLTVRNCLDHCTVVEAIAYNQNTRHQKHRFVSAISSLAHVNLVL